MIKGMNFALLFCCGILLGVLIGLFMDMIAERLRR